MGDVIFFPDDPRPAGAGRAEPAAAGAAGKAHQQGCRLVVEVVRGGHRGEALGDGGHGQ